MRLLSLISVLLLTVCLQPTLTVQAQEEPHSTESGEHADLDHSHEGEGHDAHADGHGHGHVGDPESEPPVFDPHNWRYDLSVYSLVVFLLLLTVLSKFAWGPVTEGLDQREANIRRNIEDAEASRVRSEELLAERSAQLDAVQDEVREILAEARRDAEHTKSEILADAQKEAEATKRRAIDEVNRARDQALNDLFSTMSNQVATATEHVLGRAINDEDRTRLIDQSLAELSAKS